MKKTTYILKHTNKRLISKQKTRNYLCTALDCARVDVLIPVVFKGDDPLPPALFNRLPLLFCVSGCTGSVSGAGALIRFGGFGFDGITCCCFSDVIGMETGPVVADTADGFSSSVQELGSFII